MNSVSRKLCRNRRFICVATLLSTGIIICVNQLTKFNLVSYHDHDEPDLVFRENFLRHLVWQTQPGGGGGAPETRNQTCRNTVQGRQLICDEHGFVCSRGELTSRGCCPTSLESRFQCAACHMPSQCCAQYEHCVSCCLKPDKKAVLRSFVLTALVSLEQLFGAISDQFELCLSKCRTSSMSVQHENTYRDPELKFCFGASAPLLKL